MQGHSIFISAVPFSQWLYGGFTPCPNKEVNEESGKQKILQTRYLVKENDKGNT